MKNSPELEHIVTCAHGMPLISEMFSTIRYKKVFLYILILVYFQRNSHIWEIVYLYTLIIAYFQRVLRLARLSEYNWLKFMCIMLQMNCNITSHNMNSSKQYINITCIWFLEFIFARFFYDSLATRNHLSNDDMFCKIHRYKFKQMHMRNEIANKRSNRIGTISNLYILISQ